ncbi:2-succinyl-6-hydroxy-2, 4-cyclohexadiene-1-carboxylate synthase [Bradyrhizobium ivorense]|uniref:2-succinyl-6-hydroxy-2, 4-cyclohexadiene-1-carboxylate synthase n=1 Tax=Bradyrhizobium ivorense TaxID=2511166 RepID=A0A508TBG6_9BRAD|nr:alpha/beta hydrolase [Bradyrhizobium ivorense]VIO72393.1 2-succinyl-6-hydroxy-2, 4-cyclohexadiene-1-carboxylate synthase [Bradyrhizobium ivorense]
MKHFVLTLAALAAGTIDTAGAVEAAVARHDFHVTTEDGMRLCVRELHTAGGDQHAQPVILIHGARVPGIASFDLMVPDGSLAADLALRTGRPIYVMDARGYGCSQRPAEFDQPPAANRPVVHAHEVARDIAAVVAAVTQRSDTQQVALLGWATGGMWAAYYAAQHPERVGHLVTLNAIYGGSDRHPQLGPGSPNSDPGHPDRVNPKIGAYARNDAGSLLPGWDRSIPIADKAAWRDPALVAAYQKAALDSDAQSGSQAPPAFRAPMGAIEDSFYQASGRRLFDAASITARVLAIRCEHDFWSRPEDVQAFAHDAVRAASLRVVALEDATHYVHLDRPERGRDALLREVVAFLAE